MASTSSKEDEEEGPKVDEKINGLVRHIIMGLQGGGNNWGDWKIPTKDPNSKDQSGLMAQLNAYMEFMSPPIVKSNNKWSSGQGPSCSSDPSPSPLFSTEPPTFPGDEVPSDWKFPATDEKSLKIQIADDDDFSTMGLARKQNLNVRECWTPEQHHGSPTGSNSSLQRTNAASAFMRAVGLRIPNELSWNNNRQKQEDNTKKEIDFNLNSKLQMSSKSKSRFDDDNSSILSSRCSTTSSEEDGHGRLGRRRRRFCCGRMRCGPWTIFLMGMLTGMFAAFFPLTIVKVAFVDKDGCPTASGYYQEGREGRAMSNGFDGGGRKDKDEHRPPTPFFVATFPTKASSTFMTTDSTPFTSTSRTTTTLSTSTTTTTLSPNDKNHSALSPAFITTLSPVSSNQSKNNELTTATPSELTTNADSINRTESPMGNTWRPVTNVHVPMDSRESTTTEKTSSTENGHLVTINSVTIGNGVSQSGTTEIIGGFSTEIPIVSKDYGKSNSDSVQLSTPGYNPSEGEFSTNYPVTMDSGKINTSQMEISSSSVAPQIATSLGPKLEDLRTTTVRDEQRLNTPTTEKFSYSVTPGIQEKMTTLIPHSETVIYHDENAVSPEIPKSMDQHVSDSVTNQGHSSMTSTPTTSSPLYNNHDSMNHNEVSNPTTMDQTHVTSQANYDFSSTQGPQGSMSSEVIKAENQAASITEIPKQYHTDLSRDISSKYPPSPASTVHPKGSHSLSSESATTTGSTPSSTGFIREAMTNTPQSEEVVRTTQTSHEEQRTTALESATQTENPIRETTFETKNIETGTEMDDQPRKKKKRKNWFERLIHAVKEYVKKIIPKRK